ncbi:MAG TPA: hypothetical protein VMH31_08910 [Methylomirabilota bacterium]|nr:hypothetical protein [Methylomirabilota bacterium]
MNALDFESALRSVFDQTMVQNARNVSLDGGSFPVRTTAKKDLRQVDFRFDGRDIRALEQNPATRSRWAALARKGSKVMQFLEHGRYIAVVVDGKLHLYSPLK